MTKCWKTLELEAQRSRCFRAFKCEQYEHSYICVELNYDTRQAVVYDVYNAIALGVQG